VLSARADQAETDLDFGLADQLFRAAGGNVPPVLPADEEAAGGRLAVAVTHLRWACDISPARADRERRLLTAALHLMLAEGSRGLPLRQAVEEAAPSPLRSCVLGLMAFSSGQLGETQLRFSVSARHSRRRGPTRTASRWPP
jgi:hypothetical protein